MSLEEIKWCIRREGRDGKWRGPVSEVWNIFDWDEQNWHFQAPIMRCGHPGKPQ